MNILSDCHARIDSPCVFSTRKNRPIAGYNKAKEALDSLMATKSEIGPWTIHELWRSVETSLGKCGSRFVIARMLNHTDSTMTGIYDRHEYPPRSERRSKKWGIWKAWSNCRRKILRRCCNGQRYVPRASRQPVPVFPLDA
jgi:hypothetical protein